MRALVRRELGAVEYGASGAALFGLETTTTVLGGAIPLPTIVALLAPLALRAPVLAKPAAYDALTPRLGALAPCAAFVDSAVTVR